MVRHIVMWSFRDGFSEAQKKEHAQKIKNGLENLINLIDGIKEMKVEIEPLESSSRDAVLNSLFESEEALRKYQIHPEHKKISSFVHSVMQNRICMDYYEN